MKIFSLLRKFKYSQQAAILPMVAIMFPVIIGMTGLGLDVSNWMKQRRALQNATDAAALAAAYEYFNGEGVVDGELNLAAIQAAALKEAENNGYFSNRDDSDIIVTVYEATNEVEVEIVERANGFFTPMLMSSDSYTRTRAIAQAAAGDAEGEFCMLSLEPAAPNAFVINGNVDIDAAGCGFAVNSSGDPALNINGGAGDVNVGDVQIVGTCNDCDIIDAESVTEGVEPFSDPYADLEIPAFDTCSAADMSAGPYDQNNIPAPDASGVAVLCGGFSMKPNETANFDPGVYIIDGGDFSTGSNSTLNAEGVVFILTNSDGNGTNGIMDTNGDLNLSAPDPDSLDPEWSDFEGVAAYGDRNMATPKKCHNTRGQGVITVNGAMYFPTNCIDYGGGSGSASGTSCSRIIATTIKLHGNPDISNNCDNSGARDISGSGAATIRLVF